MAIEFPSARATVTDLGTRVPRWELDGCADEGGREPRESPELAQPVRRPKTPARTQTPKNFRLWVDIQVNLTRTVRLARLASRKVRVSPGLSAFKEESMWLAR